MIFNKKKSKKDEIIEDFAKYLEETSKKTGKPIDETIKGILANSELVVLDETTLGRGKVQLKNISLWKDVLGFLGTKTEKKEEKLRKIYKDLRENFAPVSAGIEFHNFFTTTDFEPAIDDPDDKHQVEMKEAIEKFNREIFQDDYIVGLRKIMQIINDLSLTYGSAAAEIIYEHSDDFNFEDFAEVVKRRDPKTGKETEVVLEVREPDWKQLGGIVRLKIIDEADIRMEAVRDPVSYEVLYWVVDKGKPSEVKLHTWQVFWLPTDIEGTNLFGRSIIRPVVEIAQILRELYKVIGINAKKWANKRYFFVTGSEKRPWSKIHIQNFLKDVDKMVKENKTGIPVPAGFDVKEVGGELFTADSVLDALLNLICSGMKYPKEFLFGRKETENRWIAWNVTYSHRQEDIAEAIRQQLWKRHLWCLYGKQYRVPKQGVPPEQQERKPIYIPKLRWKEKGKWAKQTELDLLAKLLNVANPVSPELKNAIEWRIKDIMGFGEIGLPTTEELKRMMEQAEKEEKEKKKGKKEIGEKVPPDEEKLKKRLEKGVSKAKKETGKESQKGKARPMGGTRIPKERKIEETYIDLLNTMARLLEKNINQKQIDLELQKLKKAEFEVKKEILDRMKKKLKKLGVKRNE